MGGIILINKRGIAAIEILIVSAIIAIALTSLLGVVNFSLKSPILLKESSQANLLAQEAIEAVRTFRDSTNWALDGLGALNVKTETDDNPYHPEVDASQGSPRWIMIAGEEVIGIFTRKIIFEKVFRDGSGDIAASGTEDLGTKKVTATVSWESVGNNKAVELVTYFTDWK